MLSEVVRLLRCPVCRGALATADRSLRCDRGHGFDLAKSGYVSLLAGRAPRGDTAEMVAARVSFLDSGHYRWLADLLAAEALGRAPGVVLDAGAGTGYHLAEVLRRLPGSVGLAVDSSGYALRRAARTHPRIGAVRADLWRELPIADGVVDLVLNVFAPRNGGELRRVLAPGGVLLTVTPTRSHLTELVDRLGLLRVDEAKPRRLAAALDTWFVLDEADRYEATLELDHPAVTALVDMGPSAWHQQRAELAGRIADLPRPVTVTASCDLSRWRPTP